MTNKAKRAMLRIGEATGKRIRQLSLAEPYPKSHEVYLTIEFDDETSILIEVESRPWFSITHLSRNADGELKPLKDTAQGSIQSLVKDRGFRI